jgi:3-oxoacyl-[acyl-carrier-protein] synthase II
MRYTGWKPLESRRVMVTGAGMVTALGADWASNAAGFRAGRRGFREVLRFRVERQRVRTAAEVPDAFLRPVRGLGRRASGRLDLASRLLLGAAEEALETSGWTPVPGTPLVLGTTSGQMPLGEMFHRRAIAEPGRRGGQAVRSVQYQPQAQAIALQASAGFRGPVTVIANACASGANAIGHAWHLIRGGQADVVIAGGYEALSQLVFAGFDSLQALSTTTCRPFDAHRDGLALGEGAAVFVLETLASAERRGAAVLGEVEGYGTATDLHHLTQPNPTGDAALAAMQAACASAGLGPSDIGYVNAHGTGTPANDGSEASAITRWAGARAAGQAVSSTKAGVGHLLGAAGAVEFGICLMALRGGWLPPMAATSTPDAACGFELVTACRETRLAHALTNSFGFGGANASLVVGRGE